jgi:hypothetical protein
MSDPPRRRFMRPWKVIECDESYEIQDAGGRAEIEEPAQRGRPAGT